MCLDLLGDRVPVIVAPAIGSMGGRGLCQGHAVQEQEQAEQGEEEGIQGIHGPDPVRTEWPRRSRTVRWSRERVCFMLASLSSIALQALHRGGGMANFQPPIRSRRVAHCCLFQYQAGSQQMKPLPPQLPPSRVASCRAAINRSRLGREVR